MLLKAVSKFSNDNWLKREYAILLAKNHNSEEAIKIYKNLILELGDQKYTCGMNFRSF